MTTPPSKNVGFDLKWKNHTFHRSTLSDILEAMRWCVMASLADPEDDTKFVFTLSVTNFEMDSIPSALIKTIGK